MNGRWLGRDIYPTANRYAYINNNANVNIDFLGKNLLEIAIITLGGAIASIYIYELYKYKQNINKGEIHIYARNLISYGDSSGSLEEINAGRNYYDKTVSSLNELKDAMQEMEEKTPCKCVKKLKLCVHGSYHDLGFTNRAEITIGTKILIENEIQKEISSLFSDITFCKDCTIELVSCEIGNSNILKERLKRYKCKTIMYNCKIPPNI